MDRNKEEEDPMEKELAEDATWKRIQRNTFTRWANNHINSVNKHIEDLEQDLSDGIRLISLIEVLSGKRITRFNKRPNVRAQKLENVNIVLRFLTNEEKIKIVNIDSSDFVDSNIKLILGLIWTLILHYSISNPMWEGEEEELDENGNKKKETPKHRLLRWINNKLPELRIKNFTVDWNSGISLAALVDAIAPGLFPDWEDVKSENALETTKKAMALAEKWLNCPQLITPEDLINPQVDELSVMTYLSNFPNAKLKEEAPLSQRCNSNRVRVYNLKKTIVCGAQTMFTVETFSAGEGKLEVKVVDSQGKEAPVNVVFNEDRSKTYTCSYTPLKEGQYKIIVRYAGKEVPKSPFDVHVEGIAGDEKKVVTSGPGLKPTGVQVGKQTYFEIDTSSAGLGQVEVSILEPDGKPSHAPLRVAPLNTKENQENIETNNENNQQAEVKISRRQKEQQPQLVKPSQKKQTSKLPIPADVPTKHRAEYVAQKSGLHEIHVRFAGKEIPKSPFKVNIAPPCDLTKIKTSGRGLQGTGIRVGDNADFRIFTEGAGEGNLDVSVQGPDGKNIPIEMRRIDLDATKKQKDKLCSVKTSKDGPFVSEKAFGGTYECVYKPQKEGKYNVIVQYGEQEILRSPFEVNVSKQIKSKIVAYGPGLKGGIAQSPAVFVVDTRGEQSTLSFTIEGPSQAKITCVDNGDNSALISYLPTAPGEYGIHILSNGEDIPNSPYVAQILPRTDYDPELVKVTGKGIELNGVACGLPVKFKIDTTEAGNAPTEVLVMNCESMTNIPVKCEKRKLSIDSNNNKVGKKINLSKDNKTSKETMKQSSIEKGEIIDCEYKANELGKHVVQVNFGGVAVPGSPFQVLVGKTGQPEKVKIFGPGVENGLIPGQKTYFNVDAQEAGVGQISANIVELQSGRKIPVNLIKNKDNTYKIEYDVEKLGTYLVDVCLDAKSAGKSPIKVKVMPPIDKTKIRLIKVNSTAFLNTPNTFVVDTKDVGRDDVQIKCEITTSSGKKVQSKITPINHTHHLVKFQPNEKGPAQIQVLCDNQPVTNKPISINVIEGSDASKIKVSGSGINIGTVNQYNEFTIDTRNAGFASLNLAIEGPDEAEMTCSDNRDGTFLCKYKPTTVGNYDIQIQFGGKNVPGSPFKVGVVDDASKYTSLASKVKVYGKGIEDVRESSEVSFTIDTCETNKKIEKTSSKKSTNNNQTSQTSNKKKTIEETTVIEEQTTHSKISKTKDSKTIGKDTNENDELPFKSNCEGPVKVTISTDKGTPDQAKIKNNQDGTYTVTYKPPVQGAKCNVRVQYGDEDVPGSPFQSLVKQTTELDKVILKGSGLDNQVTASLPAEFTIDAQNAGYGKPKIEILTPSGQKQKVKIEETQENVYRVEYVPDEIGKHQIKCEFNNSPIKGSPITVNCVPTGNAEKCVLKQKLEKQFKVNEENSFTVNTKDAGKGNLTCNIVNLNQSNKNQNANDKTKLEQYEKQQTTSTTTTTKTKKQTKTTKKEVDERLEDDLEQEQNINVRVVNNKDGLFTVYYKVKEPGEYKLNLKFGGKNIPNGNHLFKVITEEETEEETETTTTKKFQNQTPDQQTKNSTKTTKKRTVIKTESYEEEITSEYRVIELRNVPIPVNTHLKKQQNQKQKTNQKETAINQFVGTVKLPNNEIDKAIIVNNHDNTISVKYQPRLEGMHELTITCDGENIQGSPFKFHVDKLSSNIVTAFGPGLTHGIAGEPCEFKIFTKAAGSGGLKIAIEGPSKALIDSQDDGDNTVSVVYTPPVPGEYRITILFANKPISGSPFTPKITGEGKQRAAISVSGTSEIKLKITETYTNEDKLVATISTPSGSEDPCYLKRIVETGQLAISFTPRESGEHLVNITKNGERVLGSPFRVNVLPKEIGNSSLVKITGTGHKFGKTMIENNFTIDTREAGYGAISLSMEGPSKADIVSQEVEPGLSKIIYKIKQPGYYLMNIKFADQHVNGSPFTIEITGSGEQFQSENVYRETRSLEEHKMGSVCKLTFTIIESLKKNKLFAFVTSPSGKKTEAKIKLNEQNVANSSHTVEFVPTEIGVHKISITIDKPDGPNIPGSPFQFTVGQLKDLGGSQMVKASGPGLDGGVVNEKGEFTIYTREAGAGSLGLTMEGPGKAVLNLTERIDEANTYLASYLVDKPGEYRLSIKHNQQHIPQSPFRIWIMPKQDLARKIELSGLSSMKNITVNEAITMHIHLNGVKIKKTTSTTTTSTTTTTSSSSKTTITKTTNSTSKSSSDAHQTDDELIAKIISPSGKEEACFLTNIDENECVLRFTPREAGPHQIHVRLNGVHVRNSPFNIFVKQQKIESENLTKKTNIEQKKQENQTLIKTTNIQKHEDQTLTKTTKKTQNQEIESNLQKNQKNTQQTNQKIETNEKQKSTKQTTTKTETTQTKYTIIKCTKTNVELTGPGLTPGCVTSGQTTEFIVNTTNAKQSKLNVKIDGPHKAQINLSFCDVGYKVSYSVGGPGEYLIQAKYNNVDISGSPFKMVVDGCTDRTVSLGEMKAK